MPQAIEWSLATPMMRPRRPCIRPDDFRSAVIAPESKCRIGPTKSEAVGDHQIEIGIVLALTDDRNVGELRIELVDMCALGDESVLHHENAVDGFLRTGRTQ